MSVLTPVLISGFFFLMSIILITSLLLVQNDDNSGEKFTGLAMASFITISISALSLLYAILQSMKKKYRY